MIWASSLIKIHNFFRQDATSHFCCIRIHPSSKVESNFVVHKQKGIWIFDTSVPSINFDHNTLHTIEYYFTQVTSKEWLVSSPNPMILCTFLFIYHQLCLKTHPDQGKTAMESMKIYNHEYCETSDITSLIYENCWAFNLLGINNWLFDNPSTPIFSSSVDKKVDTWCLRSQWY